MRQSRLPNCLRGIWRDATKPFIEATYCSRINRQATPTGAQSSKLGSALLYPGYTPRSITTSSFVLTVSAQGGYATVAAKVSQTTRSCAKDVGPARRRWVCTIGFVSDKPTRLSPSVSCMSHADRQFTPTHTNHHPPLTSTLTMTPDSYYTNSTLHFQLQFLPTSIPGTPPHGPFRGLNVIGFYIWFRYSNLEIYLILNFTND